MLRVLYTAFDLVPSPKGASTHILSFIDGLVENGCQVDLVTPGDGLLPEQEILHGAQVTRLSFEPEMNFLAQAAAFGAGVIQHVEAAPPFQLAHYRSVWGGLELGQAKKRYQYRTIFEVNGLPSIELKYHYPGLRESGILDKVREQELATISLSDAIVVPSGVTRGFLASLGAAPERITVIPNGFSPSHFYPTPLPHNDEPVIVYIGTLAEWQGLEVMLNALPVILAERAVRLRIIGRGRSRQRKALAKQIRKLGLDEHVSLEPPVPHHEIPSRIAQADVCVAPLAMNDRNITQGCCPIKVIEYMACARPVVASNLPVVRELVREDRDALLFNPDDPDDLAYQVLTILKDAPLAARLAASAAQQAQEKFTWHIAQKRLVKVYRRLLGKSPVVI
jgi:glycosyltransferase involved in cell wall biosynthesis